MPGGLLCPQSLDFKGLVKSGKTSLVMGQPEGRAFLLFRSWGEQEKKKGDEEKEGKHGDAFWHK
jgi:hypothetical protein